MFFIVLTGLNGEPVCLNATQICGFVQNDDGATEISVTCGNYDFHVKETPDEILKILIEKEIYVHYKDDSGVVE